MSGVTAMTATACGTLTYSNGIVSPDGSIVVSSMTSKLKPVYFVVVSCVSHGVILLVGCCGWFVICVCSMGWLYKFFV